MSLKLNVIIGSTRPGRIGPAVGQWVSSVAEKDERFETRLVDLAAFDLPLLDEADHPAKRAYVKPHTIRWSEANDDADAFIFVTPEYDYFAPAALVNAVQCLSQEWRYKPAGVVSYGGISGGLRSAEKLRSLLGNVGMAALPQTVPFPSVFEQISDGTLNANKYNTRGLEGLLDELNTWGTALKPIRSK